MNRYEREKRDTELRRYRDDWLTWLAQEGLRDPDATGETYAKWVADSTQVIVRIGINGSATLDVQWVDPAGHANGLFAPRDVVSVAWLAQDIATLLEDHSREILAGLCKAR